MKTRIRYALFFNPVLGSYTVLDTFKLRMQKMRSAIISWAGITDTLMQENPEYKRAMITLTYDTRGTLTFKPETWSSNDIRQCLNRYKQKHKTYKIIAMAWVLELQDNQTPHYHIMTLYTGHLPYPDKSGYWNKGMSNVKWKIRTSFYLVTYLKKRYQKNIELYPAGARSYGVSYSTKELRLKHRESLLSDLDRMIVDREGFGGLAELKLKPDWARSQYMGSAVTKDYALWKLQDLEKSNG